MKQLETEILVVGGGSTGTGVAWDAALRGLKVILVERRDDGWNDTEKLLAHEMSSLPHFGIEGTKPLDVPSK